MCTCMCITFVSGALRDHKMASGSLVGVWLVSWLVFWFFKTGFLCVAPGCPGTHSVDQFGLKIGLPLPPKCWDCRRVPPPWLLPLLIHQAAPGKQNTRVCCQI